MAGYSLNSPLHSNRNLLILTLITGAAMLLGMVLRLNHLSERTMSHVEMFVPGLPLPADLAIPPPRKDLWSVVSDTLSTDTHPPGYYIVMFFVTKVFGGGTLAIRLPSVLCGVASIGLVFWLGVLIGQPVPGCIAAVFLALNGYHIVWSQTARMYALICLLGLITAIQLLLLSRSPRPRKAMEVLYAAAMLLGLASHVFFWAILATQMLWVLINAWDRGQALPRLNKIQILVAILGSPLLAVAAYQSGNQVAFLSNDVLQVAREFIQFVYLFPGWDDTYARGGAEAAALGSRFVLPLIAFFLLCLLLLVLGIRQLKATDDPRSAVPAKSFTWEWLLSAAIAASTLLLYIVAERRHGWQKPTLKYMEAMTVLPFFIALAGIALQRYWDAFRSWGARFRFPYFDGGPRLVLMMGFVPFLMLAVVSVAFRPLMDPRGLVYLSPYLLLTLACGAVALAKRSSILAVALFVVLGAVHAVSVMAYRDRTVSPVDFEEFAGKVEPRLRQTDLIFFRKDWGATPILYYLKTDRYHLRASNSENVKLDPGARVWVLLFRDDPFPPRLQQPLQPYHEADRIALHLATAILYCKDNCR